MRKALTASSDQSSRMWHLIIILTRWTFLITNEKLCSSWPGSAANSDLWKTLQQPADPFFIDITAIWGLLHRWRASALHQGPQRPCSELSRLCLNGILIVSSFCVVVVFLSFCFLLFCPLCTFADASFDIYPPLSNQVRLIS